MISESELQKAGIKIRLRHRRGRPPEAYGDHRAWYEWQVVDGRRVAASYDFHHQAHAAAVRLLEARAEEIKGLKAEIEAQLKAASEQGHGNQ